MGDENNLADERPSRRELLDEIARLREAMLERDLQVATLRADLKLLMGSRSWRLTAPLRSLSGWVGGVRRGDWRQGNVAGQAQVVEASVTAIGRRSPETSSPPESVAQGRTLPRVTPVQFDHGAPWVDADDDLFEQGIVDRREARLLDDVAEGQVRFFREHGWLRLEQAVPRSLIDKLLSDVETAWIDLPPQLVLNGSLDRPVPMSEMAQVPGFRNTSVRYLDFHHASEAAAEIMMLPAVLRFAELCFDEKIAAMQTLLFENGTQQADHQDFAFVHTLRPACLLGAWVALEDAHVDAGPLFYWDRSHRAVPRYVFENGSVLAEGDGPHVRAFEKYLGATCRELGLERLVFTPRKGDLLIWHSALVHGGMPRKDPARTRRSIVSHYTTQRALPAARRSPDRRDRNGGVYYGWRHEGHIEGRYPL